jgi:hypothetical protein
MHPATEDHVIHTIHHVGVLPSCGCLASLVAVSKGAYRSQRWGGSVA